MHCISVSHKKAPVSVREKFAFSSDEKSELIDRLKQDEAVTGCVVLCTCNRSEIYVSGTKTAAQALQRIVADYRELPLEELLKYLNVYSGDSAIAHLFKVCCGFDSMVLGEDEILGQLRDAYQYSLEQKTAGYELNVLFQRAITCAKRIKTDTNLSRTPLSIATLVANQVFHWQEKEEKTVLVIGMSGKMGTTITKNLISKPGIRVIGTVRTHRADIQLEMKSDRIKIIDYKDRYRYMEQADIVVSATSGPHYTVTYEDLLPVLKDRRPRLFMDVAVPIDVDPQIRQLPGLVLYDIDYFETLSQNNSEIKLKELDAARAIMEEDLDEAVKEVAFHPFIAKLPRLRQLFAENSIDTLLFQIRDHVDSESLKVVLKTLDGLEEWVQEE